MVTGNLRDAGRPATLLIDPATPAGAGSGLLGPSLLKCYNLATIRQSRIIHVIGHLSDALKRRVNDCLKAALDIP